MVHMEQPGFTCQAQEHNGDNMIMSLWSMPQQNIININVFVMFRHEI